MITSATGPKLDRHAARADGALEWRCLTPVAGSGSLTPWRCRRFRRGSGGRSTSWTCRPNDNVLEIGCGPGAGAELICARLETGKLFAIDRSESGVDRTKRRCREHVESGRLTVRQIDLATLRVPVKRLHKVFAFNVNLFWVRKCADEVALLHERVLPGGAVYLFYEANRPELVPTIVTKTSAALHGRRVPGVGGGPEGAPGRRHHRTSLGFVLISLFHKAIS